MLLSVRQETNIFFKMRVVKIANCKTYLKNVIVALSRNAKKTKTKTAEKRDFCTGVTDRRTDRWTDRPSDRDAFLTAASKNGRFPGTTPSVPAPVELIMMNI